MQNTYRIIWKCVLQFASTTSLTSIFRRLESKSKTLYVIIPIIGTIKEPNK